MIREPRRGYGLAGIAAARNQADQGFPAAQIVVFLDGEYLFRRRNIKRA